MIVQFTKERGLNKIPYYNVGQRDVMITELKKSLVGPRNFWFHVSGDMNSPLPPPPARWLYGFKIRVWMYMYIEVELLISRIMCWLYFNWGNITLFSVYFFPESSHSNVFKVTFLFFFGPLLMFRSMIIFYSGALILCPAAKLYF